MNQPRGFSLIELVAVIAILALVSIMAVQALGGAVIQRRGLERVDTETAALMRALILLRRDAESVVPLAFEPSPDTFEPAFDAPANAGRLALSIAGNPVLPHEPAAGLARVVWRLDPTTGNLTRQVWPVLHPNAMTQAGPERVFLGNVEAFSVKTIDGSDGSDPDPLRAIPRGIKIEITTAHHGDLRVVVAR